MANRAEIFYGNSGDYYPSIGYKNPGFGPYLPFSIIWAFLEPKKGVAQIPIWVWDLETQSKSLPTRWNFRVSCYLEIVFPNT